MTMPLIGTTLSALAPQLAKRGLDLLSGIFRGAIDKGTEKVTDLIKEKTDININDIADDKLTETEWVQLKDFELEHQEQLLEYRQNQESQALALEMEKLRIQDRTSARAAGAKRDENDDPLVSRFTYIYAYLITGLTFIFIMAAAFGPALLSKTLPVESWRLIDTVLGFLLGVSLSAIIQYFYGSSQGSKTKGMHLEAIATQSTTGRDAPTRQGGL